MVETYGETYFASQIGAIRRNEIDFNEGLP